MTDLIIIDGSHFYAAVIMKDDHVVKTAPIVHYMKGWTLEKVKTYCRRKRWRLVLDELQKPIET